MHTTPTEVRGLVAVMMHAARVAATMRVVHLLLIELRARYVVRQLPSLSWADWRQPLRLLHLEPPLRLVLVLVEGAVVVVIPHFP